MNTQHQRPATQYVTAYERRNDTASDNTQHMTLDEEIYYGGYCLDRPDESPTGGMVYLSFDVCPLHSIT